MGAILCQPESTAKGWPLSRWGGGMEVQERHPRNCPRPHARIFLLPLITAIKRGRFLIVYDTLPTIGRRSFGDGSRRSKARRWQKTWFP
jgi:hypothetical protein